MVIPYRNRSIELSGFFHIYGVSYPMAQIINL